MYSKTSKESSQKPKLIKYKHVRRGGKSTSGQKLKIISTNSQSDKFSSLVCLVKSKGAAIFTVQETRSRKKNKHSLDSFVIFEAIRKKAGGGTMIGIHESLNPILINVYEDEFELIVVETKIGQKHVRFITGYGPQETWEESEKLLFFVALDQEIVKAQLEGKSVFVSMDANSKLGPQYIPGDLHNMSKNGEVLAEIVEKNALIVANGLLEKCKGTITRERVTEDGKVEQSTIDFVIISQDLEEFVDMVNVDEERNHVLSKVTKNKTGVTKSTVSDHNVIETDMKIRWNNSSLKQKTKMHNLKNIQCQEKFKSLTSKTSMSKIFDSKKDINILTKKFLKRLNGCISECFSKNRSTKKGNNKTTKLYEQLHIMKGKNNDEKVKHIEDEIAKETIETIMQET